MPLAPTWYDIALRLILSAAAGVLIGINRGEHGRPAGLRTTLLVCLAASVAMIQANLLLATVGRTSDSFASIDVLRLPLGILSGMGFIGGGAILRRDNMVLGVTTAATLWFVTVIGLCFGGGHLVLGSVALAAGFVVLTTLKRVELRIPQDRQAALVLKIALDGNTEDEVRRRIIASGLRIATVGMTYDREKARGILRLELHWRAIPAKAEEPSFLKELLQLPGVSRLQWIPQAPPGGQG